jgi:hypothetical protein
MREITTRYLRKTQGWHTYEGLLLRDAICTAERVCSGGQAHCKSHNGSSGCEQG